MADLRFAHVKLKDRFVGLLRETPEGGYAFDYADGCDDDIACALPAAVRTHLSPQGLHPFFEHLTPEGWLRQRQARLAEVETEDDFGLLLRYGEDCIGAVSIHDPDGKLVSIPEDADATTAAVARRRTISGVQSKILATRSGKTFLPAAATGSAEYIAKFQGEALPNIVTNEDLTLRCARILLGTDAVTESERGFVEGIDKPVLLVRRFDRTRDGARLRLEDFAQILSRPRGRDYSGKYDGSFEECAAAIRRFSARAEIDVLRFFERVVAYYLLGNGDCHLKNFSLLETEDGLRLSPAYDVVNTYIYGANQFSTDFGLRLAGEVRRQDAVDRKLVEAFGADIGLTRSAVARTLKRLKERIQAVLAVIPSPVDRDGDLYGPYAASVQAFAATLFD